MPNLVDPTLCSEARRTLHHILAQRGLGFFLMRTPRASPRLDSRRIAWVVKAAARRSTRVSQHDPDALSRTRRVLRRELIRRLAETLVEVGL